MPPVTVVASSDVFASLLKPIAIIDGLLILLSFNTTFTFCEPAVAAIDNLSLSGTLA